MNLKEVLILITRHGARVPYRYWGDSEYFKLRHKKSGHWEYMGHRILRVENPEAHFKCDRHHWVMERISDGKRCHMHFYTKNEFRWSLFNDWVKLAQMVVKIEHERKIT